MEGTREEIRQIGRNRENEGMKWKEKGRKGGDEAEVGVRQGGRHKNISLRKQRDCQKPAVPHKAPPEQLRLTICLARPYLDPSSPEI